MVKIVPILLLVLECLLIVAIIVLTVIYGIKSSSKGGNNPNVIVPYPYGPTMFFARTEFPYLDNSQNQIFFPGLTYFDNFTNQWGTSQMDLVRSYLNSSSSNVVFSTSSWVGKSLYVQRRWNGSENTYTKVRLCTGLISIDTNLPFNSSSPYKDKLYLYGYGIPYSGYLKSNSFAQCVNGCFTDNKYLSSSPTPYSYFYREPAIDKTIVGIFCAPVLSNSRTQPSSGLPVIPLQPNQVTFSVICENSSEFTSTFLYVNNSDSTNYVSVTVSKLIPYIYIEFSGIIVINAEAVDQTINNGFESNPQAKVFNFYDGEGYIQPSGEINKEGVTRFTISNGSLVSAYIATSPAVAVYTRGGQQGSFASRTFCLVKSLTAQGATKMIIGPQSYAMAFSPGPPQIPSTNIDQNIVLIGPDIFPKAEDAVKSIKCSGVTLNATTFSLNYEATTSFKGGFIFVPYIGMLLGTILGATPINNTIHSTNTSSSPVYMTFNKTFSVQFSYLDIPNYDYTNLAGRITELDDALTADWTTNTGIARPIITDPDGDRCDNIYIFGKKIFNVAQCAWIAKQIGSANFNNFFTLLETNLQQFILMRLPAGVNPNDPPNYPHPGEDNNVRLTYGYTQDMRMMGVMDCDPGGSFGNRFGNDHIIHNGYVIFAMYLYLTMKNSTTEDDRFRPFILALMRDVAQPYPDDSFFPRMRHFDFAQDLSWLAGVTDEANTESCSEVINGYYACYLMAKRFGDSRLSQFYAAILTLEIKTNQEIRFFGLDSSTNKLAKLLERNTTLWNTYTATFGTPPVSSTDGVPPDNYTKLGLVIQNTYQTLSFNTLFGANAFPDAVFIIFLPFSPITTTWWNRTIGEYVAEKTNAALINTLSYYNGSITAIPDLAANNTNILIFSAYTASDGGTYVTSGSSNPHSLAFPPPMIGNNAEYAMQFMAYSYMTDIDAYLLSTFIETGPCASISQSNLLDVPFVNEKFYTGMNLDEGTSNTVLRTSMLSIQAAA